MLELPNSRLGEANRKSLDTVKPANVTETASDNSTSQNPQREDKGQAEAPLKPSTEKQMTTQPEPKLKRRTTLGFATGIDVGKLSLAGMSKPTFDIGKQTLEIGTKTRDLIQGLEVGKQGREMGKKGVGMSKQGYKNAMRFAKKGKLGVGAKGKKAKDGSAEGSKGVEENNMEKEPSDVDDDEDGENDDAKSDFSLGDFADVPHKELGL